MYAVYLGRITALGEAGAPPVGLKTQGVPAAKAGQLSTQDDCQKAQESSQYFLILEWGAVASPHNLR